MHALVYNRMARKDVANTNPTATSMGKLRPAIGRWMKFDCIPGGGGITGTIASLDGLGAAMNLWVCCLVVERPCLGFASGKTQKHRVRNWGNDVFISMILCDFHVRLSLPIVINDMSRMLCITTTSDSHSTSISAVIALTLTDPDRILVERWDPAKSTGAPYHISLVAEDLLNSNG